MSQLQVDCGGAISGSRKKWRKWSKMEKMVGKRVYALFQTKFERTRRGIDF